MAGLREYWYLNAMNLSTFLASRHLVLNFLYLLSSRALLSCKPMSYKKCVLSLFLTHLNVKNIALSGNSDAVLWTEVKQILVKQQLNNN